ncbi:hypothetical protein BH09PAT1_BH09PAT1_5130 [soil metagenome]
MQYLKTNRILVLIFFVFLLLDILLSMQYFFGPSFFRPQFNYEAKKQIVNQTGKKMTDSAYSQLLFETQNYAIETSTIEVGNCSPNPLIVMSEKNATISFKNSDSKVHTLVFSPTKRIKINPRSSKLVTVDFVNFSPSVHAYYCDKHSTAVGVLYIIK